MPFSKCKLVIEKVSAILDREAGPVDQARFHAHMAMCAPCRRYFEQFREIRQASGTVAPQDVPEDFDRILGFVLDAVGTDAAEE